MFPISASVQMGVVQGQIQSEQERVKQARIEEQKKQKQALEELKKLNSDVSRFIFDWIDEIEELTSGIGGKKEQNNQTELDL